MANNMIHLTDHFFWQEAFITSHKEVDNVVNDAPILENIAKTAVKLEKVRAILDCPIIISSWYRCPRLNVAVGGTKNSDHLIGAAVDFIAPAAGMPSDIAKKLAHNDILLGFKQLILEHTWVHISWDMIPGTVPKLEVLSLLAGGGYAKGLTDKQGIALS